MNWPIVKGFWLCGQDLLVLIILSALLQLIAIGYIFGNVLTLYGMVNGMVWLLLWVSNESLIKCKERRCIAMITEVSVE